MKKIYIDIDNTICKTAACDYKNATPIHERIERVNSWYDQGHEITMWTARGTVTGKDYKWLTKKQLEEWGCKYNYLKMGKPAFDILIDDKAFNSYLQDSWIIK